MNSNSHSTHRGHPESIRHLVGTAPSSCHPATAFKGVLCSESSMPQLRASDCKGVIPLSLMIERSLDLRFFHHSDCSVDPGGDNTTAQNLSSFRLSFPDNAKKAFLFPQIFHFCQLSHYFTTGILILVCIIKFTILKLILNGRH